MKIRKPKLKRRHFNRCGELPRAWSKLQEWYQTPLGKTLAGIEMAKIETALSDLFGYYLLQIGRLNGDSWFASSRVSSCEVMDFQPDNPAMTTRAFQGLPHALPIQTDSHDVVLLPHVLEFSQHPHAILREVERILIPEGHLVMLMFNPWSLWALWRWTLGWRPRLPWCGRFISTTRVKDWLELLGFDVVTLQGYFFRPPIQNATILQRLTGMEAIGRRLWPIFGASHLIVARKRVVTVTPIRQSWRPQAKKIVSPGLVEPFQNKEKHLE
jgi:SAM-dependent methyltransferase